MKNIGVMGAMPEEVIVILNSLENPRTVQLGMRQYHIGVIDDINVVLVFSRWGKVAAASTVTTLIQTFKVSQVLFLGIAGAISSDLNVGDIVVASELYQHDVDASPLMSKLEVPLLQKKFFEVDEVYMRFAVSSIRELKFNDSLQAIDINHYNLEMLKVTAGKVASGDQFISTTMQRRELLKYVPDVLCVEMEGGSVAQVCYENTIPFLVIRIISDHANESAPVDFKYFVDNVANKMALKILKVLLHIF